MNIAGYTHDDVQDAIDVLSEARALRERDVRGADYGTAERQSALDDCTALYRAALHLRELLE